MVEGQPAPRASQSTGLASVARLQAVMAQLEDDEDDAAAQLLAFR
jgi:hypothetical protein